MYFSELLKNYRERNLPFNYLILEKQQTGPLYTIKFKKIVKEIQETEFHTFISLCDSLLQIIVESNAYEKVTWCHCIWWQMEAVNAQDDKFSSGEKKKETSKNV